MSLVTQRGITLIELMVGLVIGLIAVLVISQVLLVAEGNKRTTTSGSDAQVTGSLALYTIQRDIEMAGYGLSTSQLGLGCSVRALTFNTLNGGSSRTLAPVAITPGASGAPDTLRILGSRTDKFSVPTLITSDHPKTGGVGVTEFVVNNTVGVAAGDLMIAVPAAPDATNTCTMFLASGTVPGPPRVLHAAGSGADPQGWNGTGTGASQTMVNLFPTTGYPAGSYLINVGSALIDRSYSVTAGTLRLTEFNNSSAASTVTELFPQVVNLRALYGKDTAPAAPALGDGAIDQYDNAQPTTPDAWSRVVAIRIAIVVRSSQWEKEEVTTTAPVWNLGSATNVVGAGSVSCGSNRCISMPVDGDINANDWKHYRYTVYETVIPVRNLVWRS